METEAASWPAAKQANTLLVAHPAWEGARNAILDLAAQGPVTVALVGARGTGKTALLRELAGCLGDHGFPTMVLLQGDLPSFLAEGAALLIDQASCMPEPALDQLLAQRRGVAILADVERFGDLVQARSSDPVVIPLRRLDDAEMADFIAAWLRQSEHTLDPAVITHLVEQARGLVGAAVRLLGAALVERQTSERGTVEPPPRPMVPRRKARRTIWAILALAACIALAWLVGPKFRQIAAPAPTAARILPPLRPAELSAPVLVQQAPPSPPTASMVAIVPIPTPWIASIDTPPIVGAAPIPSPVSAAGSAQPGGIGMALLAQRGDTLESMYRDIYRDRAAPPFAQVVAANPRPLRPGTIVVFPAPPGGWSSHPPGGAATPQR